MRRGGARFIYCNEAPVFEHWPAARTRKSYLIKVSLKGGNSYTWRKIAASKWRILKRALFLLKGLCVGALSVCLIIGTLPSKVWRTYWELKFASNAGGLLAVFGHHYEAYK
ncbi:MAG TPA: hypothetical protein VFQ43_00145 [Nitrososphaera sp.]|nr:hypothetical protein [Nitrososphaera sp.]